MKLLRWIALLALFLITIQPIQAQTRIEDEFLYQRLEKHTVKLYQSFPNNPFVFGHICTAVLIEQDEDVSMLFTAGHCVEDDDRSYLVMTDRPYLVLKKYVSNYSDIAVLFVIGNVSGKLPASFSTRRLNIGDKIYNAAYPQETLFENNGGFIDEDWYSGSVNFLVIPGCSGSGVYNTFGELEGIVVSREMQRPVSHYIPIAEFMRFFHQLSVDGKLSASAGSSNEAEN